MATMDWSSQAGSAAATYQEFLVPAMFDSFAATLVEQAGVGEGSAVLDVACGTGAASRAAARRAGASGSVTGVDLGEPTLEVARAQPADPGAAPITWLQADATALPVEDATFDVAICQQGLQFFSDKPAALAEMHRALKPGGHLAIATWTAIERAPVGPLAEALEAHVGAEAASVIRSPFAMPASELESSIAAAGFHDVEVGQEEKECTWAARPEEFGPRFIACSPLAAAYAQVPEKIRLAVAEDVGRRLADQTTSDGRLRMPMTSNVALARR
jgi:ubiquinone/menaquinone biosynthesis C-methylase UbiE